MANQYYRIEGSTKIVDKQGNVVSDPNTIKAIGDIGQLPTVPKNFGSPGSGFPITPSAAPSSKSTIDSLTEGISTAITPEEIRQREAQQKEQIRQMAEGIFNPMIEEARATGEKKVGSAKAQLGVARGLGLSTAETTFINSVQAEVDKQVRQIEAKKAEFIASGNFQAAQQAEQALMDLQNQQNNLILAKAGMALQLMGMEQEAFQFEKQFAFTVDSFDFKKKVDIAGLTGLFDGAETLAAKQQRLQNELAKAAVTGEFEGEKTLQAKQWEEELKNMKFNNQIALFSMLSSIPQDLEVAIEMPDGTIKKLHGLQRKFGTAGGGSDKEADIIDSAAEDIIEAENEGFNSPELWWNKVDNIVTYYASLGQSVSREDADKMLMYRLKAKKGEPLSVVQEENSLKAQQNIPTTGGYRAKGLGALGTDPVTYWREFANLLATPVTKPASSLSEFLFGEKTSDKLFD